MRLAQPVDIGTPLVAGVLVAIVALLAGVGIADIFRRRKRRPRRGPAEKLPFQALGAVRPHDQDLDLVIVIVSHDGMREIVGNGTAFYRPRGKRDIHLNRSAPLPEPGYISVRREILVGSTWCVAEHVVRRLGETGAIRNHPRTVKTNVQLHAQPDRPRDQPDYTISPDLSATLRPS